LLGERAGGVLGLGLRFEFEMTPFGSLMERECVLFGDFGVGVGFDDEGMSVEVGERIEGLWSCIPRFAILFISLGDDVCCFALNTRGRWCIIGLVGLSFGACGLAIMRGLWLASDINSDVVYALYIDLGGGSGGVRGIDGSSNTSFDFFEIIGMRWGKLAWM
jgi:hypothetical protein